MVCYRPTQAVCVTNERTANGKRVIEFIGRSNSWKLDAALKGNSCYTKQDFRCGRCLGCRIRYSQDWMIRCMHELHFMPKGGLFLTLTYKDECLPVNGSLDKRVVSSFLKRFRYHIGSDIKVLYCGEYGSKNFRPHYHVNLLNVSLLDLPDYYFWRYADTRDDNGNPYPLYRSNFLESIWTEGYSEIGIISKQTVGYTTRYITKKFMGNATDKEKHYQGRVPEFLQASLKPRGLGYRWFEKYGREIYSAGKDFVMIDDKRYQPPVYYDLLCKEMYPDLWDSILIKRMKGLEANVLNMTQERLAAREEHRRLRYERLPERA